MTVMLVKSTEKDLAEQLLRLSRLSVIEGDEWKTEPLSPAGRVAFNWALIHAQQACLVSGLESRINGSQFSWYLNEWDAIRLDTAMLLYSIGQDVWEAWRLVDKLEGVIKYAKN